jgi:outer membrane protein
MKKAPLALAYILIVVTLSFSVYNFLQSKKLKIACIDTAKVLKSYKGVEELSKNLEQKNNQLKIQLDTLSNEFQSSLKEFEKKRSSLNPDQIKEEEQKLRTKQMQYEQFSASNQESLKQEEMQVIQKALEKINSVIQQYAKSKGFAAVFGATPDGNVVYVSEYVDITEDIISEIKN